MEYYYFPYSHWSRIISLVLAEKGLSPTRHLVDIRVNANFEPDYVRLNPKGVVPTLVDDGTPVCGGPRIAEHLDAAAQPMLCVDAQASWARRLAEFPAMLLSYSVWVLGRRGEHSAAILDDKIARARAYAQKHTELRAQYERKADFFREFRSRVRDNVHVEAAKRQCRETLDEMGEIVAGGAWLGGGAYSFADAIATSILYRLVDLGIVDHWHANSEHGLHPYYERLRQRPSFRAVFEDDPLLSL